MNRLLTIALIGLAAYQLHADAGKRVMVVTTASGQVSKIDVSTSTHILLADGGKQMVVTEDGSDQNQIYDVRDISNITFTIDSASGLTEKTVDNLAISYSDGIVTIASSDALKYAAWNMAGGLVLSGHGANVATLDFTAQPAGVYIIKVNNTTVKFINR